MSAPFRDLSLRVLGGMFFLLIIVPGFLLGGLWTIFLCFAVGILAYREWGLLLLKGFERRGKNIKNAPIKKVLVLQGGFLFFGLLGLTNTLNILPYHNNSPWIFLVESGLTVLCVMGICFWFVYSYRFWRGIWWMMAFPGWMTLSLLLMASMGIDGGITSPALMLTSLVATADVCAYFSGRLVGKMRLGTVSPNKTVSGVVGSILGSGGCALLWVLLAGDRVIFLWWRIVLFALLIGLLSVVGDILCSASKRWSGQKDMSSLLPGHGGILDRWDGLLFVVPFWVPWQWGWLF